MEIDALAKSMYTAYCNEVGNIAYNGDKLPKADEFFNDSKKDKQINGWRKAAEQATNFLQNEHAV